MKLRGFKVYWDKKDWWWGYYKGPNHHYVIIPPIFCLVFRWNRKRKTMLAFKLDPDKFLGMPTIKSNAVPPNQAYFISPDRWDEIMEEINKSTPPPYSIFAVPKTVTEWISMYKSKPEHRNKDI